MKYQVATITITQNDIDSGLDTAMHNPVARALARDLSLEQGVFVATDRCHAFEMQAPYRTITLSGQVTQWIQQYCDGYKVEPITFHVVLDQEERLAHYQDGKQEAHRQAEYTAPQSSALQWQAPSPN